jgi:predicted ABC-type ATPase
MFLPLLQLSKRDTSSEARDPQGRWTSGFAGPKTSPTFTGDIGKQIRRAWSDQNQISSILSDGFDQPGQRHYRTLTSGGCLVAAQAIQKVLGGKIVALVADRNAEGEHPDWNPQRGMVDHYMVQTGPDTFLDADGESNRTQAMNWGIAKGTRDWSEGKVDWYTTYEMTPETMERHNYIATNAKIVDRLTDLLNKKVQKSDPAGADSHVDTIIGAVAPFKPGPRTRLMKPQCPSCGRSHINGVPCYKKDDSTSTYPLDDQPCPDCGCPDSKEHQRRHAEQDHPFLRRPSDYQKAHDVSQEERDDQGEWEDSGGATAGQSREVSPEEYQSLAAEGKKTLDSFAANASPLTTLDDPKRWSKIKADAYNEIQKSWGGSTIDAHTGVPITGTPDQYAVTAKLPGQQTVSLGDKPDAQSFSTAMDRAKEVFRDTLQQQGSHLGVFHDDAAQRVDIDPVRVVDTSHDVEAIGAYTNAVGGAYHFASGNGFYPPHVSNSRSARQGKLPINFAPLTSAQSDAIHREPLPVGKRFVPLLFKAYNPDEARDTHGRWASAFANGSAAPYYHNGAFTSDRASLHNRIIAKVLSGHAPQPSVNRHMVIMGGGTASGKSSLLSSSSVPLPKDPVEINSDEIKTELPEAKAMAAAGDDSWAAFTHEESSYIAKQATAQAQHRGQNIILDGTGDSDYDKLMGKINAAKASGYKTEGIYATVPVSEALHRAEIRGQKTGRYVPEPSIHAIYKSLGSVVPRAAEHFDTFRLYDTRYRQNPMPLIAEADGPGTLKIHDTGRWMSFTAGNG